jgi:hypothetical protein
VLAQAASEAEKAGISLQRFLEVWCMRGSQGLQADWLRADERRPATKPLRPTSHNGLADKDYTLGVNADGTLT